MSVAAAITSVISPIKTLYDTVIEAERTTEAQGKKNKLSDRDLRHVSIYVKRAQAEGKSVTFASLANDINMTKEGTDQIGATTVWNHKEDANIGCSIGPASWPSQLSPSERAKWYRSRRGFAKVYAYNDKSLIVMDDEVYYNVWIY